MATIQASAFNVLKEEDKILRKKEKEKQRKIEQEDKAALLQRKLQEKVSSPKKAVTSWADYSDEDDEAPRKVAESSDSESSEDEVDESTDKKDAPAAGGSHTTQQRGSSAEEKFAHVTEEELNPGASMTEHDLRNLPKKDRKELKKKELDALDNLLAEFGGEPGAASSKDSPGEEEPEVESAKVVGEAGADTVAKKKKKKKEKGDAEDAPAVEPAAEDPGLQDDAARAALLKKKLSTNTKKKAPPSSVARGAECAIAEMKQRKEGLKVKRDKNMYDR